MNIEGKNIILTGASSGIGLELLNRLASTEGVKIVAVARHVDAIRPVAGKVYKFAADLSNKEGVDSLFEYATETLGDIDIFIANAGFAYLEKFENPDWKHIENIFGLNVFSPVYSLGKFARQAEGKPKLFVAVISGAALVSLPAYSLYCSTKAALHHFMQTYGFECGKDLNTMCVYPVASLTSFFDKASASDNTPLPWPVQQPETVVRKIIEGMVKNKKTVYPSRLFGMFYPIGRALPFILKIYSLAEKRKVRNWLDKQ